LKRTAIFGHPGWIFTLTLLFIAINAILIANEWFYLSLLPVVLFILYLAFVSIEKLVYIVVFFVPVSLPLELYAPTLGFNLQLPTEPILAVILVLFLFRLLYERKFDRAVLLHPISLAIYFNLVWVFMTSVTSSMPFVSFKFLISRLWFLAAFYFIATQIFRKKTRIRWFVWAYLILMLVVISYAIIHLSKFGLFNQQAAHLAATPFFNDHTSYGAILSMLLPFSLGFAITRKYPIQFRFLCWLVVFIILFALTLSYSRAAWISIAAAGIVYTVIKLKINFRFLFILILISGALLYFFSSNIFMKIERNKQTSSKDFAKHIQSISNVRTDVSNLERLNRWKSAFRMFRERPFWGWGPGTYMFNYAPFQLYRDKTPISVNSGTMGNAHSEYIGPLVESGVLGCFSIFLIIVITLYTGIRLYTRAQGHRQTRILILSATLGLITYYTHGILNNFLDTDKASALFWGYTAMIVALDVYHVRKFEEKELKKSESPA
jgi:putative inorganic carbon (hco3(-)) transporter